MKNDDNVRGQDSADHEHNAGAKTQPVDERTHEKPRLIVDPTARRGAKKMPIYSGEFHAYGDPPRGTFTRRRIRVLEQLEGAATAAQPQWQTKAIKRMHLGGTRLATGRPFYLGWALAFREIECNTSIVPASNKIIQFFEAMLSEWIRTKCRGTFLRNKPIS